MPEPTIQRPLKQGNVRSYVAAVDAAAPNDIPVLATEVDGDVDTVYNGHNALVAAYNNLVATMPTSLPPSGPAGGDLEGSFYPGPTIGAGKITAAKLSPPPAAGDVGKLVSVGAGPALAYTAPPTSLPPSGTVPTGDLTGSYPSPTIAKLKGAPVGVTTPLARGDLLVADAGPALKRLPIGANAQVLQSNGTDVVWGASLGGPPTGAAGGDLAGSSYPAPIIGAGKIGRSKLGSDVSGLVASDLGTPGNIGAGTSAWVSIFDFSGSVTLLDGRMYRLTTFGGFGKGTACDLNLAIQLGQVDTFFGLLSPSTEGGGTSKWWRLEVRFIRGAGTIHEDVRVEWSTVVAAGPDARPVGGGLMKTGYFSGSTAAGPAASIIFTVAHASNNLFRQQVILELL